MQKTLQVSKFTVKIFNNGILLPKLGWSTVRKDCSSDWEKLLKFEAEGPEFANFLRLLDQFIERVKGNNIFWTENFLTWNNYLEQFQIIEM